VGLQLGLSVTGGILLGLFLDNKMNTSPIFTIIFMLTGSVAGFYNLYAILKKIEKNS
jgi:ATP synthase protein I